MLWRSFTTLEGDDPGALVDLDPVRRRRSRSPRPQPEARQGPRTDSPRSLPKQPALALLLGNDLRVEGGDLGGDCRPAVTLPSLCRGPVSAPVSLIRLGDGLDQRLLERLLVV